MKKKILIVGYGSIGRKLLEILPKNKFEFAILRTKKKTKISSKIRVFFKTTEALKFNPSYIFICSSANLHFYYFKKFINLKAKMFIEKPLTINKKELNILKKTRKNIIVGYFLRFYSPLIFIKNFINKKIKFVRNINFEVGYDIRKWRPTRKLNSTVSVNKKLGGGALFELSHEIDLAIWMLGFPNEIYCDKQNLTKVGNGIDDSTKIILNYNIKKITSFISLDFIQSKYCRKIKVILDNEVLSYDFDKKYFLIEKNDKKKKIFFNENLIDAYKNQINYFLNKFDPKKKSIDIFADKNSSIKLSNLLFKLIQSNKLKRKINF